MELHLEDQAVLGSCHGIEREFEVVVCGQRISRITAVSARNMLENKRIKLHV